MGKQTSSKTKAVEKEKVLSLPMAAMKSFMGKSPSGPAKKPNGKPGLFDKLKTGKKK